MVHPVFWIMGLSGSGKTTLTNGVLKIFPDLHSVDNDKFRGNNKDFSKATRIATVDALRKKVIKESEKYPIIVNKITPYEIEMRQKNRELIPNYHEIWCSCPPSECIYRDPKGLYKKALNNELQHMIGISDDKDDVYEIPKKAFVINTLRSYEECLYRLAKYIEGVLCNY